MKKFFRILGITIISILAILYIAFLFVLPNAVDLNKLKPDIQKIVKEQANLILDFKNAKISTTPLLSAGIIIDEIKVTLPDNSELVTADKFKGRIALPSLLLLTVKVSTAEIINPTINIDIVDGKAFKAVKAFEEILNKNEEQIEEKLQTAQKPIIDPASIKILVPKFKIENYKAIITDLKTSDFLKLQGNEIILGYNNGNSISFKTDSELYLNENKNITAKIDIDTIIPKQSKLDDEDDKAQRVEIPFINPVEMYKEYDLKTNIDSKIRIRTKNKLIASNGYLNIDNFTLKLADLQLPESKIHIIAKGTKLNLDTDLFITENEKISLLGMLNYGKNPASDIKITSTQINLDNVITLIKATLDSLHIQHELAPIKGEGYFITDTYVKTNFKKLISNGTITIKDCIVKNTSKNQPLAKVNSIISLDNNMLKFIDTSLEIAKTLFKIDGQIDEKSIADINIFMEKMPVSTIFDMFLPEEINNIYAVNSGDINVIASIKGELKKAIADMKVSVENLSITDKINKINYLNNLLTADFTSNFKTLTGKFKNKNFKLKMNGASIDCNDFALDLEEKDIIISPSTITINNSSSIDLSGDIKNYIKNPIFNFDINGKLITNDLKQLLGKDLEIFIDNKGAIPLSINFNGDVKKQTLTAEIKADKNNYITPITIKNVENLDTILKTVIDFKGDRLKIKETGLYTKNITQDPKDPEKEIITLNEIIDVEGTITKLNTQNPNINLIKIKTPKELNAIICGFPQSKLKANANMFIFGDLTSPRMRGTFDVKDISIPELFLSIEKAIANFEGKDLDVNVKNILANGSDFNVLMKADLNPSKNFVIKNLNVISNLTDADKLMEVSNASMKYMPAPNPNAKPADIPVVINSGTIDMKHIKTGAMNLYNTTGIISMFNNIFYINDLLSSAFDGKIKGDVSMNLITSEIKANVKGNNLDVEKTLLEAAAMKDTLTGKMDFSANLGLRGATYEEQMKTLKGKVNFEMKNGSLGPFGKIENLILAENIRESAFFETTIGTILNSLISFDTTHFNTLNGDLSFENGITKINSIKSSGDVMATYIFGNFDLLKNEIDIKLRGKLGSQVSNAMGPLALINPVNLIKATPGMSLVFGKIFFLFTEVVNETEMNQIPSLGKSISDNSSTNFQVVVRGDVAKPLTLVKSFKWLSLQSDIDKAKSHVGSLPTNTKIPEEYLNLTTLDKEQIKTQATEKLKENINNSISEDTKKQIEQGKEAITNIKNVFSNKESIKNSLKEKAEQTKTNTKNQIYNNLNSLFSTSTDKQQ